jgi:hypothetical protein
MAPRDDLLKIVTKKANFQGKVLITSNSRYSTQISGYIGDLRWITDTLTLLSRKYLVKTLMARTPCHILNTVQANRTRSKYPPDFAGGYLLYLLANPKQGSHEIL